MALDADGAWTVEETLAGGGFRLTRTPLDGSAAIEVAPIQYEPRNGFDEGTVALHGDWVYFVDGYGRVKRAKTDGNTPPEAVLTLPEEMHIARIRVVDGALVFDDFDMLYAVGIDTK